MKSTFSRALVGFIILTAAVSAMALVALSAADKYAPGYWVVPLLVILIALVTVMGIYGLTLHNPIMGWVKEPAKKKVRLLAEAEAEIRRKERAAAERNIFANL